MKSEISAAIKQICEEKNISADSVIEAIEAALAVAYRKDFGEQNQNIKVTFGADTAQAEVFDVKQVVADEAETLEEFDPKKEITLTEAQKIKKDIAIGDELKQQLFPPAAYGRMAAQTAKQVIIQKLREAERDIVFQEFKNREGEILTGIVQGIEGRLILIDLGHATAILPPPEQIIDEHYRPGQRIKVYLISVSATNKGPEVLVSRSHPDMVKKLFALEVPEIASGAIEIKGVSREAGSRSKIAVASMQSNIDPIGSCVGQRGTRVQTIISELGGEKIDIVQYNDDPVKFIINALSPAKILSVKLNEKEKSAVAEVKEEQLSLAIGRRGQNVRLAARLTGWRIDIVGEGGAKTESEQKTTGKTVALLVSPTPEPEAKPRTEKVKKEKKTEKKEENPEKEEKGANKKGEEVKKEEVKKEGVKKEREKKEVKKEKETIPETKG